MSLKKLAESFNYLSGIKDLSIMKEDLNEAIKINGKEIDPSSVEIEGVDTSQGPDDGTVDAFISLAKFTDGQMLNDDQLDMMNDSNNSQIRDFIQRKAEEKYSMGEGTCGYSVDGKPADTPAGPNLIKKSDLNESVRKVVRKVLKQIVKEGDYFNSLEEDVNEDIQKAIQEFRENQNRFSLKDIAEKYNLNEIELENALTEEPNEGNAFAVARLKAIKAGESEFEVGGKKHKVTDVSDDDKKAAEEL